MVSSGCHWWRHRGGKLTWLLGFPLSLGRLWDMHALRMHAHFFRQKKQQLLLSKMQRRKEIAILLHSSKPIIHRSGMALRFSNWHAAYPASLVIVVPYLLTSQRSTDLTRIYCNSISSFWQQRCCNQGGWRTSQAGRDTVPSHILQLKKQLASVQLELEYCCKWESLFNQWPALDMVLPSLSVENRISYTTNEASTNHHPCTNHESSRIITNHWGPGPGQRWHLLNHHPAVQFARTNWETSSDLGTRHGELDKPIIVGCFPLCLTRD